MSGGSGDDQFVGGRHPDYVFERVEDHVTITDTGFTGWLGTDRFDGEWTLRTVSVAAHVTSGVLIDATLRTLPVTLRGGNGSDTLLGGGGNDDLAGGDGGDFIRGLDGHDRLSGDSGNDVLGGAAGDDTINAGAGDDSILGGPGDDVIDSGPGTDTVTGGGGTNQFSDTPELIDDALAFEWSALFSLD